MLDSGTSRGLCPGRRRAHRSLSSCSSMSRSSCSQKKSAATWVAEHCLFPNADAKVRTFHDTAKSFHDFFQKKSKMGTQGAGNGGRRGQRRGEKARKTGGREGMGAVGENGNGRELYIYTYARVKGKRREKKRRHPPVPSPRRKRMMSGLWIYRFRYLRPSLMYMPFSGSRVRRRP